MSGRRGRGSALAMVDASGAGTSLTTIVSSRNIGQALRRIIEHLLHHLNRSLENDIVVVGIATSITGAAAWVLRWLWRSLSQSLKHVISKAYVQVVVSDSRLYLAMVQWLSARGVLDRSCKFKAVPKRAGDSDLDALAAQTWGGVKGFAKGGGGKGRGGQSGSGARRAHSLGLQTQEADVSFLPMGLQEAYRISFEHRPVWVQLTSQDSPLAGPRWQMRQFGIQSGRQDTINVHALNVGRWSGGRALIQRLLVEVQMEMLRQQEHELELWRPEAGNWSIAGYVTKRPLKTVVLQAGLMEDIIADVAGFISKEAWYRERDIPHRRGYLLEGPPGCGKTSLIRAIASKFSLPLCLVSLKSGAIGTGGIESMLHTAPEGAILVLEDIDATDQVQAFGTRNRVADVAASSFAESSGEGVKAELKLAVAAVAAASQSFHGSGSADDRISMSELLNAIDGLGSQMGRLIFMTTNHPEQLDVALLRDGRVDRRYHLGYATREMAFRMFLSIVRQDDTPSEAEEAAAKKFGDQLPEGELSVSQLQGFLVRNHERPLDEIVKLASGLSSKAVTENGTNGMETESGLLKAASSWSGVGESEAWLDANVHDGSWGMSVNLAPAPAVQSEASPAHHRDGGTGIGRRGGDNGQGGKRVEGKRGGGKGQGRQPGWQGRRQGDVVTPSSHDAL